NFKVSWSKDSRWLAFAHDLENQHTAIALYDTKDAGKHVVTTGYYDDDDPVFDPEGKYLFYRSGRDFSPVYSDMDNTLVYPNSYQLVAVTWRKDVGSPLAPRNDDEGEKDKKEKDKDKNKDKEKKKEEKPKKDEPQLDEKKDEAKKEEAKDEEKKD